MPAYQSKRWMCTWNNPPLHCKEIFAKLVEDKTVSFATGQFERAPTTGTLHFQGYVETPKKITLAGLKKILDKPCWDAAKGNAAQCINYCTKDDTRDPSLNGDGHWSVGESKQDQGKRHDLWDLKEALDRGEDYGWTEQFPGMIKYFRGAHAYLQRKNRQRSEMTLLEFHYGKPGLGKTTCVQQKYPNAFWMSPGKWWDGYQNQETVVLDEFNGWLQYSILCRLADSTPMKLEVKGGHIDFNSKRLIIISNYMPSTWYQNRCAADQSLGSLNINALLRRINRDGFIYMYEKLGEPIQCNNLDALETLINSRFY